MSADPWSGSYQNIAFQAYDVFWANSLVSGQTLAIASGQPVDWALSDPYPAPAGDNAASKEQIILKVHQVNGTIGQNISDQVNTAIKLWGHRVKGLQLVWDGTVIPEPACDAKQYPNGCSAQQTVDTLYLKFPCGTSDSLSEFVRRFGATKGLQLVFTNTITALGGGGIFGDEVAPFDDIPTCKHAGNIVVMANTSKGNILAHGVGHSFQLRHVDGASNAKNLMCSPNGAGCPTDVPGDQLSPDQIDTVRANMKQWEQ